MTIVVATLQTAVCNVMRTTVMGPFFPEAEDGGCGHRISYPYSDMANTNGDPSGHGRCLPTFVGSDDEHEFSKKNSL